MLAGQQVASAAESGLYLVGDQQYVVAVADLGAGGKITVGGNDDAAFALDRLDEKGGGIRRDRRFQCRRVAVGNAQQAGG